MYMCTVGFTSFTLPNCLPHATHQIPELLNTPLLNEDHNDYSQTDESNKGETLREVGDLKTHIKEEHNHYDLK